MGPILGTSGELWAGPYLAASFGSWTLDRLDDTNPYGRWALSTRSIHCDPFWLAHGGTLTLRLRWGPQRWRWPTVTVIEAGDALTIRGEGRPEVTIELGE